MQAIRSDRKNLLWHGGRPHMGPGLRRDDTYALRASAPSIMLTAFCTPYTATKEPKRGPFSWPVSYTHLTLPTILRV